MSGPVPTPIRAVFDCNIFLQALGNTAGPAGLCLQAVWDGRVALVVSPAILDELSDVASRPETLRKFPRLSSRYYRLLQQLEVTATFVKNVPSIFAYARDPRDAPYVDLAIATGAYLLVSRDKDLLDLMNDTNTEGRQLRIQYPTFQVLTPPQFLQTLSTT